MYLFADFNHRLKNLVQDIDLVKENREKVDLERIVVEKPRDSINGHLSTNAAMVLSRPLGLSPRSIAELIVERIKNDPDIDSVLVAGAGFINIHLSSSCLGKVLSSIVAAGADYGRLSKGKGIKANVEYVSANPTGPMHVGHCRGAVLGDTLANLMEFSGYEVTREYYINDAGAQIDVFARSVFWRYQQALGRENSDLPEGFYPGLYLQSLGKEMVDKFGARLLEYSEEKWLPIVKEYSVETMMNIIKDDLNALNIQHDLFVSEKIFHKDDSLAIKTVIENLKAQGYIYRGILPPPKSKVKEDWESDREQLLFRSTAVGDDIDRPLCKSDNSYTYFAADLAYFMDKCKRGFDKIIYVLGSDHSGYVKRLQAVAEAVAGKEIEVSMLLCELVRLYRDGAPIKMSKRAGDFITLREVVDEVGCDSVRFMMLWRKNSEMLDFDFCKVKEQSKDNPIFYVQYAHARCMSIFRQAKDIFADLDFDSFAIKSKEISQEDGFDAIELQLIVKLAEYPRIVENATIFQEPHRLVFYLYDLASIFHSHWNHGKERSDLRFVQESNKELTILRLKLVYAVALIIKSGLYIAGIQAPHEMN
ncbi:arginine--tRNA ligase [Candidatus Liberibacter sp.]|uniref:arginine--tRNA ligase n=1 Tax=Candidatus Liberibacter sp. TaxID=34022 RepID=UPI0015F538FF|nr:arginine--tRNA ligase [Candidatus Liberibacter sp.]MBA5724384.1 arginine--tRNA ligase [Candidatus Liberibacter sp.]